MQLTRSTSLKRMQWTAVILCAAAIAINYLDRSTIAIANPQMRAEFHMSAAQFGALQSAWSLAYALAQIPVGLLIDRLYHTASHPWLSGFEKPANLFAKLPIRRI